MKNQEKLELVKWTSIVSVLSIFLGIMFYTVWNGGAWRILHAGIENVFNVDPVTGTEVILMTGLGWFATILFAMYNDPHKNYQAALLGLGGGIVVAVMYATGFGGFLFKPSLINLLGFATGVGMATLAVIRSGELSNIDFDRSDFGHVVDKGGGDIKLKTTTKIVKYSMYTVVVLGNGFNFYSLTSTSASSAGVADVLIPVTSLVVSLAFVLAVENFVSLDITDEEGTESSFELLGPRQSGKTYSTLGLFMAVDDNDDLKFTGSNEPMGELLESRRENPFADPEKTAETVSFDAIEGNDMRDDPEYEFKFIRKTGLPQKTVVHTKDYAGELLPDIADAIAKPKTDGGRDEHNEDDETNTDQDESDGIDVDIDSISDDDEDSEDETSPDDVEKEYSKKPADPETIDDDGAEDTTASDTTSEDSNDQSDLDPDSNEEAAQNIIDDVKSDDEEGDSDEETDTGIFDEALDSEGDSDDEDSPRSIDDGPEVDDSKPGDTDARERGGESIDVNTEDTDVNKSSEADGTEIDDSGVDQSPNAAAMGGEQSGFEGIDDSDEDLSDGDDDDDDRDRKDVVRDVAENVNDSDKLVMILDSERFLGEFPNPSEESMQTESMRKIAAHGGAEEVILIATKADYFIPYWQKQTKYESEPTVSNPERWESFRDFVSDEFGENTAISGFMDIINTQRVHPVFYHTDENYDLTMDENGNIKAEGYDKVLDALVR